MDSRGLGALLAANERAREGAPPVNIFKPSQAVQRLLDVSGVRGVLVEIEELPTDRRGRRGRPPAPGDLGRLTLSHPGSLDFGRARHRVSAAYRWR